MPWLIGAKLFAGRAVAGAQGLWASIPPKARLALLIAVAALLGLLVHNHYAHKALKAADTAGYNRRSAEDAKAIAALRVKIAEDAANANRISQELRSANDKANLDIRTSAADIVRNGPGAASCRRIAYPTVPASPGQSIAASGTGHAAVDPVPDESLIGLPFAPTVSFAEEADLNRSEVLAWRAWYPQMVAQWEKMRAKP